MTPAEPQPGADVPPVSHGAPAASAGRGRAPYRWYHKMSAVVFATICLEIGCFLLIFPWTSYATDFTAFRPEWGQYLKNMYVQGAISGLGLVNLYIAFIEVFRLRRFAGH